ncbi:DUF3427 domain-containing protein [Ornithinibacillus halotolerans]|uniref:DUF3427 domain-containing protein n=1 Tax=Ornithinibacillus halotolerans TaxID=1274357 RepID=A0A916WA09_9BACI|nr:DUF3427 domain-containing protein [Ornithinibacillus halotolerans]GGA80200.1 hypothetical protein GCM10008025_24500 [Ornithinibacillus halotolerans]
MNEPFVVGQLYSRNDLYRIIGVPGERQGGIWNTGYTIYNNDIFIFANINTAGSTGHNYDNKFIDDRLFQWFSKNNHSLKTPSIQKMINPSGNIYIFTRENIKSKFTYNGKGIVKEAHNQKPVKIIWKLNN